MLPKFGSLFIFYLFFLPVFLYIEPLAESWSQVLPQVPTQFTKRLSSLRYGEELAHDIKFLPDEKTGG